MIDCPNGDVRDLLPDYLHDRLTPADRRAVDVHLASCAACRDELALLRDLRGTLRRAPAVDMDAIAAAIPAYRAPAARRAVRGWRVAAAVAAIIAGGASVTLLHRTGGPANSAAPEMAVVTDPGDAGQPSTTEVAQSVPGDLATGAQPAESIAQAVEPLERELAVAGGAINELSDGELATLVADLESLDPVPSTEVETGESLTAAALRGALP
jgi:anti-sigma factor RsiW